MTTAAPPADRRATLYGIQYLRALAALAVVVFHAAERSGYAFAIGAAGVDVFFVISGFIMWVIADRRPLSPGRFLADRIRRIVPVYWLATGVMVAGALAGLFPNLVLTVEHVVASLAFVPARSPSTGALWPVLVQGWTLNYEMFFYLVFAASLVLPARLRLPAMATVFAALVATGLSASVEEMKTIAPPESSAVSACSEMRSAATRFTSSCMRREASSMCPSGWCFTAPAE